MTLAEIRDIFVAEYAFLAQNRKMPRIEMPNALIAAWIARAQQDMADRLNLLLAKQDVSLTSVTTYTTHNLNSNYGEIVKAEIQGTELDIVGVTDINTTVNPLPRGRPSKVAVYDDGSGNYLLITDPLPEKTYTLRVWYKVNTNFYSPSGDTTDWGSFDGTDFSGDLVIANKYAEGVLLWMLARVFPDYKNDYERFVLGQKSMQGATITKKKYTFAGI